MEKHWVKIFSSPVQHKVELLKNLLSRNGILSITMNAQDSLITSIGETELYVNRDDVLRAKVVIGKTELDE